MLVRYGNPDKITQMGILYYGGDPRLTQILCPWQIAKLEFSILWVLEILGFSIFYTNKSTHSSRKVNPHY